MEGVLATEEAAGQAAAFLLAHVACSHVLRIRDTTENTPGT